MGSVSGPVRRSIKNFPQDSFKDVFDQDKESTFIYPEVKEDDLTDTAVLDAVEAVERPKMYDGSLLSEGFRHDDANSLNNAHTDSPENSYYRERSRALKSMKNLLSLMTVVVVIVSLPALFSAVSDFFGTTQDSMSQYMPDENSVNKDSSSDEKSDVDDSNDAEDSNNVDSKNGNEVKGGTEVEGSNDDGENVDDDGSTGQEDSDKNALEEIGDTKIKEIPGKVEEKALEGADWLHEKYGEYREKREAESKREAENGSAEDGSS